MIALGLSGRHSQVDEKLVDRPQDTGLQPVVNPPCWASQTAVSLNLTIPCTLFDIRANGTAATDIKHIVALAEAYDSGLAESQFRTFAADLDNLTLSAPDANRRQKSDRDAGDWGPPENRG